MIRAYDEILLDRAADSLGSMLDFAAHSLHIDANSMLTLFTASGTAARFGCGDIRMTLGMSGPELAYEVLYSSGLSYERTPPRHTMSQSAEYWFGHSVALAQWQLGVRFEELKNSISLKFSDFQSDYIAGRTKMLDELPQDISEEERARAARRFGGAFSESFADEIIYKMSSMVSAGKSQKMTRLKSARLKSGLSQSKLAKAAGIPVRTIQQYEQRQKDLGKARAEYIIKLARVLNCEPSSLLEI
jgi:DNA-binding transcriptional regulator YiaG